MTTYEIMWRSAHTIYDIAPDRFQTDHLAEIMRPKEIYSLWKRLLDPFGAANMPFPDYMLSDDEIATDLTETEFNNLYAWLRALRRRPIHHFDPDAAAAFLEEHSARAHFS
jgi:hypothetical protein